MAVHAYDTLKPSLIVDSRRGFPTVNIVAFIVGSLRQYYETFQLDGGIGGALLEC